MNNEKLKAETFTTKEANMITRIKGDVEEALVKIGHHPNMVVAGGCFASWLNGDEPKDIDVFFLNLPEDEKNRIFLDLGVKLGRIKDNTKSYNRQNDNVTDVWNTVNGKYQFIFTKHKTRHDLVADFDYIHCMVSYHNYNLYITRKTFDAIMHKHLIVNKQSRVFDWRRDKFIGRGWQEPNSDDVMSVQAFNNMIRQPVSLGASGGGKTWTQAARTNPIRTVNPYIDDAVKKQIDTIIDVLNKTKDDNTWHDVTTNWLRERDPFA